MISSSRVPSGLSRYRATAPCGGIDLRWLAMMVCVLIAAGCSPPTRLAAGEEMGTSLIAPDISLGARKQWLADHVRLAGRLQLDAGAVRALVRDGKSLLPIGVVRIDGTFERGEIVGCFDPSGREIARGLVNYSSQESARILGKPSSEIHAILGYVDEPELIHRDNLVLLG